MIDCYVSVSQTSLLVYGFCYVLNSWLLRLTSLPSTDSFLHHDLWANTTLLQLVGKPPLTNASSFSASLSVAEVLEDQLHPCPI